MVVSRMRQTIILQSPPTLVDSYGQLDGSWTNQATRRAEVKQLSGRELTAANQLYNGAQYIVTLWYEDDLSISTDWRISWGSRTLEIGNIHNVDQQNRTWQLLCSEVTDG